MNKYASNEKLQPNYIRDNFVIDIKKLDEIVEKILLGLVTDDKHHKQWYLNLILRSLCTDKWCEKAEKDLKIEPGIAP